MTGLNHSDNTLKTIGLIGGMSWESTASYYALINRGINQALGGLHSAPLLLVSVDFAAIAKQQQQNDWHSAGAALSAHAMTLEQAGADVILLCTNTMHKVAAQISQHITIPFIHIADALACAVKKDGLNKIGLLGTRFTMQEAFYRDRLKHHGIDVIVPQHEAIEQVDRIIFDELCKGQLNDDSREYYLSIVNRLRQDGAQGIALGCTEIALLINQQHTDVPLYDTTRIHSQAAVDFAISGKLTD